MRPAAAAVAASGISSRPPATRACASITGGDVQPVNIEPDPGAGTTSSRSSSPRRTTRSTASTTASPCSGAPTSCFTTRRRSPRPDERGALRAPKYKGQITIPNNPIQIADAALYLQHSQPDLGINDPYELNKKQFDAAVALLKQQQASVKLYWNYDTDEPRCSRTATSSLGADLAVQTTAALQQKGVPVKDVIPTVGATGWADTWMLADEGAASELRLPVDEVRHHAEAGGAAGAGLRARRRSTCRPVRSWTRWSPARARSTT